MDAYIYCADIYCADCGQKIRQDCTNAGTAPDDPDDESTYDSDEFPKGPYADGGGEADCPQHCGAGDACINAYTPDGCECKVGAFLENELTADGVKYVVEEFVSKPDSPVVREWVRHYSTAGYDLRSELNGVKVALS